MQFTRIRVLRADRSRAQPGHDGLLIGERKICFLNIGYLLPEAEPERLIILSERPANVQGEGRQAEELGADCFTAG